MVRQPCVQTMVQSSATRMVREKQENMVESMATMMPREKQEKMEAEKRVKS